MHELILAGGGSGHADHLLPVTKAAVESADIVIASERFLKLINAKKIIVMKNVYQQLESLPKLLEQNSVAVVVSGDPLYYSLCRTIQKRFPDIRMKILPGIGSLQLLGAEFGITMENAEILSLHGRECSWGTIASAVCTHETVFFFCSKENGPREISKALLEYKICNVEICVGASLASPEQKLYSGTPQEIVNLDNPELCTAAVKNPSPSKKKFPAFLPDDAFLRNQSPMTKEEIRAVVISKLRLRENSAVWDIGAGTGSISVECARMCPFGNVYALEYKKEALEILEKNRDFFRLENLHIIKGRAEETMSGLDVPDCIFIGGSSGGLTEIIGKISSLSCKIRLVVSAVTLETQAEAYSLLKEFPDFQAVQLSVGYGKKIGNYSVMECNHPVTLYSCYTRR